MIQNIKCQVCETNVVGSTDVPDDARPALIRRLTFAGYCSTCVENGLIPVDARSTNETTLRERARSARIQFRNYRETANNAITLDATIKIVKLLIVVVASLVRLQFGELDEVE